MRVDFRQRAVFGVTICHVLQGGNTDGSSTGEIELQSNSPAEAASSFTNTVELCLLSFPRSLIFLRRQLAPALLRRFFPPLLRLMVRPEQRLSRPARL